MGVVDDDGEDVVDEVSTVVLIEEGDVSVGGGGGVGVSLDADFRRAEGVEKTVEEVEEE